MQYPERIVLKTYKDEPGESYEYYMSEAIADLFGYYFGDIEGLLEDGRLETPYAYFELKDGE